MMHHEMPQLAFAATREEARGRGAQSRPAAPEDLVARRPGDEDDDEWGGGDWDPGDGDAGDDHDFQLGG